MVLNMFDIKESLTNRFGTFPLLQEYSCREKMKLNDFGLLKSEGSNVYIVQDRNQKEIGYRIYKSYLNKNCDYFQDSFFLEKLKEKGNNINSIDFPYGVITYRDHIIGQVIPYYEGDELITYQNKEELFSFLEEAYSLIKELYDENIYYRDIHAHNFIHTKNGLKLIDFDRDYVHFKSGYKSINNYYKLQIIINYLHMAYEMIGINQSIFISDNESLDRIYDELMQLKDGYSKVKKMK